VLKPNLITLPHYQEPAQHEAQSETLSLCHKNHIHRALNGWDPIQPHVRSLKQLARALLFNS